MFVVEFSAVAGLVGCSAVHDSQGMTSLDRCKTVMVLELSAMDRIFTALHGMQTRSYDENSVCPSVRPSVCPSVKRVHCDKTEEKSVQIFIRCERTFSLVF